jgi:hypothetical protein
MKKKKFKFPTPKVFYLHFNRIAMQRGDGKVWSIRTSKTCFHAEKVWVDVQLETVYKPKGQQPRAFFKGVGYGYWIERTNGEKGMLLTNKIQDAE